MQFINAVLAVLGFVAVAQASSLTFLNKDVYDYVMCFIPVPGHNGHDGAYVSAGAYISIDIDYDWNGVVFTIFPGEDAWAKYFAGTVLAEVNFHDPNQPWLMSYDISAIGNAGYNDGVHRIWPRDIDGYNTGCYRFPCPDVYLPGDGIDALKSHTTTDENLVIQIGLENRFSNRDSAIDPELLIRKKSYPALPADPALTEILARHFNHTVPN